MKSVLEFHHLGLLSSRPDVTADRLQDLGYQVTAPVIDPLQEATLRMAVADNCAPRIEIITPLRSDSPLGRQLKTRDNSVYHMCYFAPGFDEAKAALLGENGRIFTVSEPKAAILFEGRRVAFYFVDGLGLVEVIERGISLSS